jgi:hypothetical protein
MIRFGQSAIACCLLTLVGCGNTGFPVTGRVTFKDGRDVKVLSGGTVALESADETKPVSARGTIQDDGSFTVGVASETDGVPPGKYIVLVTPQALARPNQRPKGWPPVNAKYGRRDQTTLKVQVEPKNNVLELVVD